MKEHPIEIPLTQGYVALVDEADVVLVNGLKWHFNNGYAYGHVRHGGQLKRIAMHSFLMNTPAGMHTDHINHNKLDNRRCNLRVVSPRENILHRRTYNGEGNPFFGKSHTEELKRKVSEIWRKPVLQVNRDGDIIREWESTLAAERETGISNGNISSVCLGRRKTAGGFKWTYKNENTR